MLTIPVLLGVATLVFALIHLIPGDPAQAMLGETAVGGGRQRAAHSASASTGRCSNSTAVSRAARCAAISARRSARSEPVAQAIIDRLPATLELAAAAMLVAIGVSIPLGIIAAVRRGTIVDHAATTLALTGVSIPNFWLGPLLAIVFAVELGWLPVSGRGTLAHLVLPGDLARRGAGRDPGAHDAGLASRRAA